MDVTEFGMVMDRREVHPENASLPMDVTESTITNSLIESQWLYQGASSQNQSSISPVPDISSNPFSSKVQTRSFPHVPEAAIAGASDAPASAVPAYPATARREHTASRTASEETAMLLFFII